MERFLFKKHCIAALWVRLETETFEYAGLESLVAVLTVLPCLHQLKHVLYCMHEKS